MIERKMDKNEAGFVSDIIRVCGPAGKRSASHSSLIELGRVY